MKRVTQIETHREQQPLACSAQQLAHRLGVSLRHVRRMDSAGLLPKPVRLGRSVRWPVDEVQTWLKAGAPNRRRWEQIKGRQAGRDGR